VAFGIRIHALSSLKLHHVKRRLIVLSELFPPDIPEPPPELLSLLRLNLVPGIGPRNQRSLIEYFGSAQKTFEASVRELEMVSGIGPKLARSLHAPRNSQEAEDEWWSLNEDGFRLYQRGTDEYPTNLNEVGDAPNVLYCRGSITKQDELAVAIVGSRRCTIYGQQQAERIAKSLAMAGITVVSGMARGIDAYAHQGALAGGGRTIAVSATGLKNVYPPEHKDLAKSIAQQGAIVCESKLHQHASAGLFPQRNRIISGLSVGVIIIEANRKSGALHTAKHAMEQGREVMALPGRVDNIASEGCHDLIRDGVTLIRHADDVLESLGPLIQPVATATQAEVRSPRELSLSDQQKEILNLVTSEPRPLDEVLRGALIDPSRVLATLTILEMKRMVRRLPGGLIVRVTY
jgi:DNA processing protein